ncbi:MULTISPECIES: hypothetical protein [unclassified Bradyrhizobium]|uniref:hypothetical protein n=1 Tax=unclassified Bradyrhizobium TaxID=2631580 RepID=UPI001BD083AA|nr:MULTISPECIES: hypothetical protein [unclassified Bradyrhizobium]WOH52251.1 hypothetical protein RX328_08445 [Bradyrhizobium sp. sBnM-33]
MTYDLRGSAFCDVFSSTARWPKQPARVRSIVKMFLASTLAVGLIDGSTYAASAANAVTWDKAKAGMQTQIGYESITKQMSGLNQIRPLANHRIAVPLNGFIASEPAWKTIGTPVALPCKRRKPPNCLI